MQALCISPSAASPRECEKSHGHLKYTELAGIKPESYSQRRFSSSVSFVAADAGWNRQSNAPAERRIVHLSSPAICAASWDADERCWEGSAGRSRPRYPQPEPSGYGRGFSPDSHGSHRPVRASDFPNRCPEARPGPAHRRQQALPVGPALGEFGIKGAGCRILAQFGADTDIMAVPPALQRWQIVGRDETRASRG